MKRKGQGRKQKGEGKGRGATGKQLQTYYKKISKRSQKGHSFSSKFGPYKGQKGVINRILYPAT